MDSVAAKAAERLDQLLIEPASGTRIKIIPEDDEEQEEDKKEEKTVKNQEEEKRKE